MKQPSDYKIIKYDKENQSIVVYFENIDFSWNIDIPIDGTADSIDTLDGYIRGFFPYDMYIRKTEGISTKAYNLIDQMLVEPPKRNFDLQPIINRIYSELRMSDWTQLNDCELSSEEINKWKIYRSKLRSLLENTPIEKLDGIEWPTKPSSEEFKINVY